MALISVGIDHEHASMDFLERAAVAEHEWSKVLRTLVSHRNVHEAVFLSTCLRTEVIAVIDLFHGAIEDITLTLADVTGLEASEFENRLTVHFDRGVVSHLFAVAAGLKSVVPGEFEILGQLRRALDLAQEEQTAGAELTELFHRAIAAGRKVRAETAIARGTTSFAQASVAMALEELDEEFADADVVVVGAGQLATGVVKSLLGAPRSLAKLTLLNRTLEKAEALRDELADSRLRTANFNELGVHLSSARLAVVAVEASAPVVSAVELAQCDQALLIVDLGVPRAVTSEVAQYANIRRVDIGDLRARVDRALDGRQEAIEAALELVQSDVERFVNDQRARGAAAIVSELRERFDEVIEAELARREQDLSAFTLEQRELVRSLLRSTVAKVAHRPTMVLKEAAGTDQGVRLTEATRQLFDL